jgi:hypothetical protein
MVGLVVGPPQAVDSQDKAPVVVITADQVVILMDLLPEIKTEEELMTRYLETAGVVLEVVEDLEPEEAPAQLIPDNKIMAVLTNLSFQTIGKTHFPMI